MSKASLSVAELALARGGVRLVEGLSFVLYPGEVIEVTGPNGSGKSTLLRTLAGLQNPAGGRFESEPAAYAGHLDAVKPRLTVRENLRFWGQIFGASLADQAQALALLDLERLADRLAGELSQGQRRRVGLARVVLARRSLWLLDEPTASLDTRSCTIVVSLLARHCAEGGAALVATHVPLGLTGARVLALDAYRAKSPWPRARLAETSLEPHDACTTPGALRWFR